MDHIDNACSKVDSLRTPPGFLCRMMTFNRMKSTWKCITLATVDYRGSIVGCLREDQRPAISLLLNCSYYQYRQTSKSSPHAQSIHLSTAIVPISIWHTLTSAAVHFTNLPCLLRSRILFYHSCLLDNMSTFHAQSCRGYREKRWMDGHTHAHTHTIPRVTIN